MSTFIVGFLFWQAAGLLGQSLPLSWALVFGALISLTDPIGGHAYAQNVKAAESLEVEMQGESLFNDGVGIVVFTILLAFAAGAHARSRPIRQLPASRQNRSDLGVPYQLVSDN